MAQTRKLHSILKLCEKNQCTYIFFFLSMQSRTLVNPHESKVNQKMYKDSIFLLLGITKCNFAFLMLVWECHDSCRKSSPTISLCHCQPQILNRPAVLRGIKVNTESFGKIWKFPWSLKTMGKLIKFQHGIFTQFNLMISGLIVEMSSDQKLMSISLWDSMNDTK